MQKQDRSHIYFLLYSLFDFCACPQSLDNNAVTFLLPSAVCNKPLIRFSTLLKSLVSIYCVCHNFAMFINFCSHKSCQSGLWHWQNDYCPVQQLIVCLSDKHRGILLLQYYLIYSELHFKTLNIAYHLRNSSSSSAYGFINHK
jgi:hypothetical protein